MYLQKRVPEVSLRDRQNRLVDRTLLAKSKEHGACSNGHKKHAPDAVHPGAVITGLGQIEAASVHHSQWRFGMHNMAYQNLFQQTNSGKTALL